MKFILCLFCIMLSSCKPAVNQDKEYATPEEEKVIDEMQKGYQG